MAITLKILIAFKKNQQKFEFFFALEVNFWLRHGLFTIFCKFSEV